MRSAAKLCVPVLVFSVFAQAQQKPCLTASKFGPADQIGNVNHIGPARITGGVQAIVNPIAIK